MGLPSMGNPLIFSRLNSHNATYYGPCGCGAHSQGIAVALSCEASGNQSHDSVRPRASGVCRKLDLLIDRQPYTAGFALRAHCP